jgi:hypothetical protein
MQVYNSKRILKITKEMSSQMGPYETGMISQL